MIPETKQINQKRTEWITISNNFKYRKTGKFVEVNLSQNPNIIINNGEWKTLATLPVGYRPTTILSFPAILRNASNSTYLLGQVQILTDGTIRTTQRTGTSNITIDSISASIMFNTTEC